MQRCPHCATPAPTTPICRSCGLPVEAPPQIEPLPGVEPTRYAPQAAAVSRLDGLETTEEVLGDTSIPEVEAKPAPTKPAPAPCRRCGAPAGAGRVCERCGMALAPVGREAKAEEPVTVRCRACGVPNPAEREVCCACGMRL
jgi:hypothetical protein